MYGQTLIEFVQGPGEVIFLPHGLTHAVLNVHDNVAYTENFLYVSALPGKKLQNFVVINQGQIISASFISLESIPL